MTHTNPQLTTEIVLVFAALGQGRTGRRLVAYFACIAYVLMRPSEVQALTRHNLLIDRDKPDEWGVFNLDTARPQAGKEWTDSGEEFDR